MSTILRTRMTSISTRIVAVSLAALAFALLMIGGTLWLSWQLEGGAAAINDAGSLRMRAYRLTLLLHTGDQKLAAQEIESLETTLESLRRGDPARPLVLPGDLPIRQQYAHVIDVWREEVKPLAQQANQGDAGALDGEIAAVDGFVAQINALVKLIEFDNARKTAWLRTSQVGLIFIAIAGTVAIIYLLYLWIIGPVLRLQAGVKALARRDFEERIPVETNDEFGQLASGFNAMTEELQAVYRDLEQRVQSKTEQLAAQNRELSALYEMAAYLSLPNSVDAQCKGFLQRVMYRFEADGGSLRVLNPDAHHLHLVFSEGVPESVLNSAQCQHAHQCLCGRAAEDGVSILRDFTKTNTHQILECRMAGFVGLASFRIASPQVTLGSFTLHFRKSRQISSAEMQLLETLGQQLGLALDNARMVAHGRQLAIAEERNLVAQGLHDSLAQSLNFLNLQLQLLERSIAAQNLDGAQRILPRLQEGLKESYNDVRELLANFRTRVGDEEIASAVESTLDKFQAQTGIPVSLEVGGEGPTIGGEQKLQILFIVQEALSNIRKHAKAKHVSVCIKHGDVFELSVADDGCGFEYSQLERESVGGSRIGLRIMEERAGRMSATLDISSTLGQGTRIHLAVPTSATGMIG